MLPPSSNRCRPNAKSETRRLIWGNQVPIRPLTLCALSAKQTKRIDQLAEPKKSLLKFCSWDSSRHLLWRKEWKGKRAMIGEHNRRCRNRGNLRRRHRKKRSHRHRRHGDERLDSASALSGSLLVSQSLAQNAAFLERPVERRRKTLKTRRRLDPTASLRRKRKKAKKHPLRCRQRRRRKRRDKRKIVLLAWEGAPQEDLKKWCHTQKSQLKKAQPKTEEGQTWGKLGPEYHNSWGRGSIIWKLPSKAFFSYPSARIEKLSEPKRYKEEYLQKRPFSSPTWHVKDASQIPEASSRVVQLAVAKATHPEYEGPKQVETKIPPTALTTHPTTRVVTLSEPKIKIETLYFERRTNELPIRPVSNAAMSAQPSSRTQLLARAKTVNEQYLPVRPVKQPIRRSTLKYVPTTRIEELSVPNARTPLTTNGINLDAFKVKEAAKVAICSPRIVKLAEPVKR
ncbi:testicular haploid expressed gene protein-like isoform X3 [Monodelphis domestica]|uniref:testicular haploid expressed gene protein-like isoform X3 n=1 Tax=Monodelphis domestica TaxID=13616 RepID=UPI0024E1BF89|nr:testicular haploid expressed gene protein-like isoform X3 [Monodelphis domestica]